MSRDLGIVILGAIVAFLAYRYYWIVRFERQARRVRRRGGLQIIVTRGGQLVRPPVHGGHQVRRLASAPHNGHRLHHLTVNNRHIAKG
jgi:hypothetical protein